MALFLYMVPTRLASYGIKYLVPANRYFFLVPPQLGSKRAETIPKGDVKATGGGVLNKPAIFKQFTQLCFFLLPPASF